MKFMRIEYYPFIKEKENISSILFGFLFSLVTIPTIDVIGRVVEHFIKIEHLSENITLDTHFFIATFFGAVLFSPPIETIIFQLLIIEPIGIKSKFRITAACFLSTVLFTVAHVISKNLAELISMFFLGLMLSGIYIWARKYSFSAAFMSTLSAHFFHNLLVLILVMLFPELA